MSKIYVQQMTLTRDNKLIFKNDLERILIFVEGNLQDVRKSYIIDFLDMLGAGYLDHVIKYINNNYGYKHAISAVDSWVKQCSVNGYSLVLVTNMTQFLNPIEFNTWSDGQNKFLIYILDENNTLHHIQDLTDRELRQAHNIEAMYRNGEFDE